MSGWLLLLAFHLISIAKGGSACPSVCMCKWKNGKQTVECVNRDLLAIPKGMDQGTQVLEFSGNNLQMLSKEKFLRLELINLQRIYLSRCKISSIDDRTFKGLTNLVELDLSDNLLVSVPTETFIDCPSLMKLTLSYNPIKVLRKAAFNHLSFLNTLEIRNCEVAFIEEGAFLGLHSLEWLYIPFNKLRMVRGARLLPQSLRGIELQGNPWECDCHIVDLHAWLVDFTIPQTVEPVCKGPSRLSGRAIKSIPLSDLACLPDVSPTTFFLEISEGKNVSLLCQVRAVPEARVSWWFQGRTLQNDTMVAPGVHLIYYVEEGTEDKRSELFIYNTNTEDNGTFTCTAENNAGAMYSNFTIRIVLREQPSVVVVTFSLEYVVILASTATVLAVLLLIIILVLAKMCRAKRPTRKKRSSSKVATLSNSTKDSLLQDSTDEYSDAFKEGPNTYAPDRQHEMMVYSTSPVNEDIFVPTVVSSVQVKSPTSLHHYQLEQNPDLINDTESVSRHREGDGKDERDRNSYGKAMENAITADFELSPGSLPMAGIETASFRASRDSYRLSADVHLNPIELLNPDGGRTALGGNFYTTLPHKRANKGPAAANLASRFSREAELLPRSSTAYEHYCPGVRYTADGYPARDGVAPATYLPSPPEGYKSDISSPLVQPCCSSPIVQWPHCVPANLHNIKPNQEATPRKSVAKRCVSAQTESDELSAAAQSTSKLTSKQIVNAIVQETLPECLDEGYEGESGDSNSNPS